MKSRDLSDLSDLLLLATPLTGWRDLAGVPSMVMAADTQLAAAAALLLPALWAWPSTAPSLQAWGLAAALAVLASGVAYILYFRLISNVGPTQAASVTFLVPVFASLWGALALGEVVTLPMLIGGAVVLAGSAVVLAGSTLVLGVIPRQSPRTPPPTPAAPAAPAA